VAKLLNADSVVGAHKRYTRDTFQNFATKTGIGTDNLTSDNTYGFNPISRVRTLIEWMYRGSWLCGVGVDCVADDMTREGIDIQGENLDARDTEKIIQLMRSMQVWQSLNQVGKWARLYGGALGMIWIEGQNFATPLRIDTVQPGQFKGIIPMDRWMVTPDLNTIVKHPGPDFGLPAFYTIDASSPNFPIQRTRVHYSRFVRMEGVELPYWQKTSENMWGISVLERLFDRLTAFDSATQGAAQLVYRSYLRTISIENLRDIIATGGDAFNAVVKNIEMIRAFQTNEGLTVMDTRDTFEVHQNNFAGLSDVINSMGDQISGALQIPLTRLFGQAPAGLNATGESDMRTYYDNILRLQERWFRRPLDVIVPLVAKNADIDLPDGWSYEFKSLWQLTDIQKAEVNTSDVTALVNVQGTGVLPTSVFLDELRKSGKKTGMWQSITDDMIKEATAADEAPSPDDILATGGAALGHPQEANPLPFVKEGENGEEGAAEEGKPGQGKLPAPKTAGGLPKPKLPKDPADKIENPDKVTAADAAHIIDVQDIPIYIENPKGTIRRGGKGKGTWEVMMPADYGFIEGIPSAEGKFEQLDCYIGDAPQSDDVWVVDQLDLRSGGFDEHKCFIGFKTQDEVMDIYQRAFSDGKGKDRMGQVSHVKMETFKSWMKTGNFEAPYALVV
jgi:phage-related protein (TIGR01555 family)